MIRFRSSDPGRLVVVVLSVMLTFTLATAAGYSLRSHGHPAIDIPPLEQQDTSVKGVVQSVTSDSLTVKTEGGLVTLRLSPSTPMDAVQKTTLDAVKPGDWVNAGGVHHDQTVYALTALIVIPASDLESPR